MFFTRRFYLLGMLAVLLFVLSYFFKILQAPALIWFMLVSLATLLDYVLLFFTGKPFSAQRMVPNRMSNGDSNEIHITLTSPYPFATTVSVIDELPPQLQTRDFVLQRHLPARAYRKWHYLLTPTERGEYHFGAMHFYFSSMLGMLNRQWTMPLHHAVSVYPSFVQMKKYQLVSQTTFVQEQGSQRMRKIGHSLEFEQIKDYVSGDDIRAINWKATARRGQLMVNNYVDERSQQIFCIIDKGRLMKMPFNGLSLLDYAINAVLALSNVCLQKQDRVGLISFSTRLNTLLAADRKPLQRENIMEALYKEQTAFQESDYEMLYMQVRHKVKQRSLLMLFTNFETLGGLKRQLPYLRSIARHHLLMLVFFENTELNSLAAADVNNVEDVYTKTIAEKMVFEKKAIVKELQKYGILSVLAKPQELTITAINKYLELKARQAV